MEVEGEENDNDQVNNQVINNEDQQSQGIPNDEQAPLPVQAQVPEFEQFENPILQ